MDVWFVTLVVAGAYYGAWACKRYGYAALIATAVAVASVWTADVWSVVVWGVVAAGHTVQSWKSGALLVDENENPL